MSHLTGLGIPVSVLTAPSDGGWEGGQPNTGMFNPYATVAPGQVTPAAPLTFSQACNDWDVTVRVRVYALHEGVVDDMVDAVVGGLNGSKVDANPLVVVSVNDMRRDSSVTPPLWGCEVVFRVRMSGIL